MAQTGLVTVVYKCDEVLEGFFKSLAQQSYRDYHLYIVDNSPSATTDRLIENLAQQYSITAYTHVKNGENVGVARGNNQGIELALNGGAQFILLLNNDIEFYQQSLLEDMVSRGATEHIIIPKIFYYNTRTIWMAGGNFMPAKAIVNHVGVNEADSSKFNNPQYFSYAPTCFMLISRKVFETIGLMDEKYFVYYDDTDFIVRATEKSFRIYYMPQLEVFHKVSSSTGGGRTLFSIYYLNRNRIYFINKNMRFPAKQVSMAYTLLTRGLVYLKYNSAERKQLMKAVKDGFAMGKSA